MYKNFRFILFSRIITHLVTTTMRLVVEVVVVYLVPKTITREEEVRKRMETIYFISVLKTLVEMCGGLPDTQKNLLMKISISTYISLKYFAMLD